MEVNTGLETLGTTTSFSNSAERSELDQAAFLRLFLVQLQTQDPLNPATNEEFIAQLAQFTTLEQTTKTATLIEDLLDQGEQQAKVGLVELIGHEILANGNTVQLSGTGGTPLAYELAGEATSVTVAVADTAGNLVRTITVGPQAAGQQVVTWDGLDNTASQVSPGTYQFSVQAITPDGTSVPVVTFLRDVVASTIWANGKAELVLTSGQSLTASEILSVL